MCHPITKYCGKVVIRLKVVFKAGAAGNRRFPGKSHALEVCSFVCYNTVRRICDFVYDDIAHVDIACANIKGADCNGITESSCIIVINMVCIHVRNREVSACIGFNAVGLVAAKAESSITKTNRGVVATNDSAGDANLRKLSHHEVLNCVLIYYDGDVVTHVSIAMFGGCDGLYASRSKGEGIASVCTGNSVKCGVLNHDGDVCKRCTCAGDITANGTHIHDVEEETSISSVHGCGTGCSGCSAGSIAVEAQAAVESGVRHICESVTCIRTSDRVCDDIDQEVGCTIPHIRSRECM